MASTNTKNAASNMPGAASAQLLGRRYQPTALDIATENDRANRAARETALALAASLGEPPEIAVERAAAYFSFLTA